MFLDDTACNLASLNVLTFFDSESRRFDMEGYRHGIRLWTIVLEISVLMASFPSEEIARRTSRPVASVRALLYDEGSVDDRGLVALATDLDALENEVRKG